MTNHVVSGANDYIFVARIQVDAEPWPIDVPHSYVHIIGTPDQGSPSPLVAPDENAHGFDVTSGGGVEIAGFLFSQDKAWLKACINATAGSWMDNFHHNFFAWSSEAYDGILLGGGGGQTWIHDSYFGAHGFEHWGVYVADPMGRTRIEDNVFIVSGNSVTGANGIVIGSANQCVIRNNVFQVPDSAAGEAIYITGSTHTITGNVAMSGKVAPTLNPYRDTGAGSAWGANYIGIAPAYPIAV